VEGLRNRLEALASPQLVTAFNTNDTEKARFFVQIFGDMERGEQLLKYYRKCLKARNLKLWEKTVDENQHLTALEWFQCFFETLEKVLKEQVECFLFGNTSMLSSFIS
jgi:conserved oligomeric Golgi complex subunit 7